MPRAPPPSVTLALCCEKCCDLLGFLDLRALSRHCWTFCMVCLGDGAERCGGCGGLGQAETRGAETAGGEAATWRPDEQTQVGAWWSVDGSVFLVCGSWLWQGGIVSVLAAFSVRLRPQEVSSQSKPCNLEDVGREVAVISLKSLCHSDSKMPRFSPP